MYLQLLPHPFIPSNYIRRNATSPLTQGKRLVTLRGHLPLGVSYYTSQLGGLSRPRSRARGGKKLRLDFIGGCCRVSCDDCAFPSTFELDWDSKMLLTALLPWQIKVIATCYVTKVLALLPTLVLASPILGSRGFFEEYTLTTSVAINGNS